MAKHTYVDGLSDVDALVVLNDSGVQPRQIVSRFAEALAARLPSGDVINISAGNLAVTVTYSDGTQIQLLPAVERNGRTSIASDDGQSWRFIRPHKFAQKLTEVNQANGRAVVPTIKLAKGAISSLASFAHLSGYHVEAIAVDAFRSYSGRRDHLSMLNHLIDHARTAILKPTGDITGQSVHIDAHLGEAGSAARRAISTQLEGLSNRLSHASNKDDLRNIFDV